MIDHFKRQQQIVEREYLLPFAQNINQEAAILGGKQRKWPVGARYFYALQAIYVKRQEREASE